MANKILTAVLSFFISIENKVIEFTSNKFNIFFIIISALFVNANAGLIFANSDKFGFALQNQMGFMTPASPIMEGLIHFHDDLFVILMLILFFFLYIFISCIYHFGFKNASGESLNMSHQSTIEVI
jgi:heme/copper-type cytochrome/quinol oxidase subunit 2